jgi:hypothetical protein
MIIKEAVYEDQMKPVRTLVSEEVYGCDHCHAEIHENTKDFTLRLTAFSCDKARDFEDRNDSYGFCSWSCCFRFLETLDVSQVDFIDLPYLNCREGGDERGIADFLNALKPQSLK